MDVKVGDKVHGKIVKITKYGAFVEIEGGIWGLIHISKLAEGYVKRVEDHVKQGQEVDATVIGIDDNGKISLSIVGEKGKKEVSQVELPPEKKEGGNFENKLDKFLKDSENKISKIRNARIRKTRGRR